MSLHQKLSLSAEELRIIQETLAATPRLERAWIFGSRAKGTARFNSDLDLAVQGLNSDLQVEALADRLDQLPLPYEVDVLAVEGIKNPALLEHINRVGVVIFEWE